jgi:hypothetical protein
MSIWPFGTSRKDRKRIEELESKVTLLLESMHKVAGFEIGRGMWNAYHPPSLLEIKKQLESLDVTDHEIMDAAGLERYTVMPRTYITKKKGNK